MKVISPIIKSAGVGMLLLFSQAAVAGPGDSHRGGERLHAEHGVLIAAKELQRRGDRMPSHHKQRAYRIRQELQHRRQASTSQVTPVQAVAAVPELDSGSAIIALGLLAALGGVLRERRRA